MRLNEVANHSWDVRVAFAPHAEVNVDSAAVLVDLLAGLRRQSSPTARNRVQIAIGAYETQRVRP